MAQGQCPHRSYGIGKQRVGPVKRVDEAEAADNFCPAGCLNRSAQLQGKFVELLFPLILGDTAFMQQSQQIAIGADIIEPVVMDSDVADMRSHIPDRAVTPPIQEAFLSGGVIEQQCTPELKALGPFGPAPGGIVTFYRIYRRSPGRIPRVFQGRDLLRGRLEQSIQLLLQRCRGQVHDQL